MGGQVWQGLGRAMTLAVGLGGDLGNAYGKWEVREKGANMEATHSRLCSAQVELNPGGNSG